MRRLSRGLKQLQTKRVLLGCEQLEPRQLLASDMELTANSFDGAITAAAASQLSDKELKLALKTMKPTHFYQADGQEVALVIHPTRVAVSFTDDAAFDTAGLSGLGLTLVRQVTTEFAVFETAESIDFLEGLSSVEHVVPVYYAQQTDSEAVLLDEIIVALQPGVTAAEYFADNAIFSTYRPLIGTPDQFVATVAAGMGEAALAAANSVDSDPRLAWVAPNFYQTWQKYYTPNDPRFTNQWHLHNTGQSGGLVDADPDLPEAWDVVQGGSASYVIGVIDDGVVTDHPDLNPWRNPGEVVGDGIDNDGNGWVDDVFGWNFVSNNNQSHNTAASDAHGTAVAGVAAARGDNGLGVAGASYGSQVISARIFEGNLVASDANIAGALYYMGGRTANGLGTWRSSDLVNNSWGGGANSAAINAALTWGTTQGRQGKGAPYLFATGNGFGAVSQPAVQSLNIPGVIAIGATNNLGQRSDYSNFGPAVDLVAPSNDTRPGYLAIDTTDRLGAAGYAAGDYTGTGSTGFGGTSSATPLATGITALAMHQADRLGIVLNPAQLRSFLRANTDLINGASYDVNTGKNLEFGFGRLNAAKAVANLGKAEISVLTATADMVSGTSLVQFPNTFVEESVDLVFRVRNQGTSVLNLTSLTVASGPFSVVAGPGSPQLAVGEATTFTLRFMPAVSGTVTRTVTLNSNDTDEAAFTFDVSGVGVDPSIGGSVFEDWDGDSNFDPQDVRIPNRSVFIDANNNGQVDSAIVNYSNNIPVAIPDLSTVTSSINVTGFVGSIFDVNVTVNITHTFNGDLAVTLISPSGLRVPLFLNVGGSGDNFVNTVLDDEATIPIASGTAPFTGSFIPASPLSVLDGESANGIWRLEVADQAGQDIGTINNWRLTIQDAERIAVTRPSGSYAFVGLAAGTYNLRSILPNGWSAAGNNVQVVTLASASSSVLNRNFGTGVNNRFYGQVFNDFNGNGAFDGNEPPAAGRQLFVDANNNGLFEVPVTTNYVNNTAVDVPDVATVTSSLVVSGVLGTIADVNLKLNIATPFVADMDVYLIHPDGTRVELFTDVGGSGDNFVDTILDDQASQAVTSGTAPFTGSYRPEGSLISLKGKDANGTWRLEVTDDASGDLATLVNWELILISGEDSFPSTALGTVPIDFTPGTYRVRLAPLTGWSPTLPVDGLRTVSPSGAPLFDQRYGTSQANFLPTVTADAAAVTGVEGANLTNTGTYGDADVGDVVALYASVGTIVRNANGTWSWSHAAADNFNATAVTITADDQRGGIATTSFTIAATNVPPTVQSALSSVSGNVLGTLVNTGTYGDVAADTVSLTTSHGTIVNHNNGTWSWSITPTAVINNQTVTVTATDEDGGVSTTNFTVSAAAVVSKGDVFYRGSGFQSTGGVSGALDTSKSLLQAGATTKTTSPANVSNYTRGINGLVIDVAGLVSTSLTPADFIFRAAPSGTSGVVTPSAWPDAVAPTVIDVTPGVGTTPARVRLEWPDNAIENTWLQIIVRANANTGLARSTAFYFGSAVGDANLTPTAGGAYRIGVPDLSAVQANVSSRLVSIDNNLDIDKNRRVGVPDLSFVQSRVSGVILLVDITIPAAGSAEEGSAAAPSGANAAAIRAVASPLDFALPSSQIATTNKSLVQPASASPRLAPSATPVSSSIDRPAAPAVVLPAAAKPSPSTVDHVFEQLGRKRLSPNFVRILDVFG